MYAAVHRTMIRDRIRTEPFRHAIDSAVRYGLSPRLAMNLIDVMLGRNT